MEAQRRRFVERALALHAAVASDALASDRVGATVDGRAITYGHQNWAGLAAESTVLDRMRGAWARFAVARQGAQPTPRAFIHASCALIDRYTAMVLNNYKAGRPTPNDASMHIHVDGCSENMLCHLQNGCIYSCEHVNCYMESSMAGREAGTVVEYASRIGSLDDFVEQMCPARDLFVAIEDWCAAHMPTYCP